MLRPVVAVLALVVVVPSVACAQDMAALCRRVRHPPVGAWSEFKFVGGRNDAATIRMSIVGTENREGAGYLWLEMAMRGFAMGSGGEGGARESRPMITRMLVTDYGPGMRAARATIMKIGGAPAMEMPGGRSRGPGAAGAPTLENCRNAKVIGWESVTVPAGTFRALHVVNASGRGDSWIDPELPFALVKEATGGEEEQRHQLVLIAHGMGARSQITERPRPFDPRLFMQMMTGGRGRQRP